MWTGPNLVCLVATFWCEYLIMIGVYLVAMRIALTTRLTEWFTEIRFLRNSLEAETIELLECMKSWFRLGIFTEQDLHVIVSTMEEGAAEALEFQLDYRLDRSIRRWTSLVLGSTMDCRYSFILDRIGPPDRRSGLSGALPTVYHLA